MWDTIGRKRTRGGENAEVQRGYYISDDRLEKLEASVSEMIKVQNDVV